MNPEQQIEDIKNGLRELMRFIIERGEPLSEEMKLQIARVMEHAANRISQLRQEPGEIPETPINLPEMTEAMPSSNIYGFNYDYDNGNLLVKFQGNDGVGQGPVYAYQGVPLYMFNLFRKGAAVAKTTGHNKWGSWFKGKTPSIGAAMDAFIKNGGYSYQRVA